MVSNQTNSKRYDLQSEYFAINYPNWQKFYQVYQLFFLSFFLSDLMYQIWFRELELAPFQSSPSAVCIKYDTNSVIWCNSYKIMETWHITHSHPSLTSKQQTIIRRGQSVFTFQCSDSWKLTPHKHVVLMLPQWEKAPELVWNGDARRQV